VVVQLKVLIDTARMK